ncbi:hypothetical protein EKO04_004859 [Ascochyta lentis]|uniref:Uncharacterized protein n=1 Tax=Ascochyta lentis TaxID=205686 RepID=A0A8H7J371_9PLEO|nr:hypothetical protein EKO04_004859 [Ascochyta lentis]
MSAAEPAPQPDASWDEAQCMVALAQLEQLQAQIDGLRLAIPSIIEPFHRPPIPATFKLYSQGVIGSQNGIKALNDRWKTPEVQGMLEHARKSYEANPDLSACTFVPAHGWVERERRENDARKGDGEQTSTEGQSDTLDDERISLVVAEVQKAHPSVKLETYDDNRGITTQFIANSMRLSFKVNIEREKDTPRKLSAECLGNSEPFLSITRCIASRPQANDLTSLLEMIIAYKTVKDTSCANCGRLLDDTTLIPTARRIKQVTGANESSEPTWEALHEGCL